MYFLLVLLFNSMTQPFLVMIAIPFGIVGVIIAFALHGEPLGFVGMLGVIGLAGIVVNDSLVLVDHINQLRKQRPDEDVSKLIVEGASNRLRAVILTSLTTIAGLMPLAYGIGGTDPYMGSHVPGAWLWPHVCDRAYACVGSLPVYGIPGYWQNIRKQTASNE